MRILLVHPSFAYSEDGFSEIKDSLAPVLGANGIADFLRSRGHEALVVDPLYHYLVRSVQESFEQTVLRLASTFMPDIVAVSVLSHLRAQAQDLILKIKKSLPDSIIAVGGVHVTDGPELAIAQFASIADLIVAGAGEMPLLALANRSDSSKPLETMPGVLWARKGLVIDSYATSTPTISKERLPANYDQYCQAGWRPRRVFFITSQGCPYSCRFCSTGARLGRQWSLEPEEAVAHISYLQRKYGITEISFHDETFLSNRARAKSIFDLMARKLKPLNDIYIHTTMASLEKEVLLAYRRAGGTQLFVGVESGALRIRAEMNKPIAQRLTNEEIVARAQLCRDIGIRLGVFIIVGWPGETEEDRAATWDLLEQIQPHDLQTSTLKIYPGTEIYKRSLAEGKICEADWLDLSRPYFPYLTGEDLRSAKNFGAELEAHFQTKSIRKPFESQGDRFAKPEGLFPGSVHDPLKGGDGQAVVTSIYDIP